MPGLELTVAMPGLQPLTVGLTRLREDISDWREFWEQKFTPFFYEEMRREFITEGASTGDSWADLSPAYAQWKAVHYPAQGILVRTGDLKASVIDRTDPKAIYRASQNELVIGTEIGYAKFHQYGTRHMPQRPVFRVDEAFMGVVGKSMQEYVQAAWTRRRQEAAAYYGA